MTSKDYTAIAASIKAANATAFRTVSGESYAAVSATLERIVADLGDVFEADNPRYDHERFVQAWRR